MVIKNLDTKVMKAVLSIEKKVIDINNILRDINMKLCHIIKYKRDYYLGKENLYKNEKWQI